ncbi:hypothetical protein AMELA_G00191810 [Ameiurus melas]|uniref:Uncharacterized protein n=1 Tax=Ameiurus melas TaxID=219545 RepID=A0A7J6A8U9_AMEME|nr:hypothetical protein AMELA_G00191810 [Ameiurus melas]
MTLTFAEVAYWQNVPEGYMQQRLQTSLTEFWSMYLNDELPGPHGPLAVLWFGAVSSRIYPDSRHKWSG